MKAIIKKTFTKALASALVIALINTASAETVSMTAAANSNQNNSVTYKKLYSLNFNPNRFTDSFLFLNGQKIEYRAYENIVYVSNPADISSEILSIYVPKAYLEGGTINGYSAHSAPIFMPNGVGGYMPGPIKAPTDKAIRGRQDATLAALAHGYVVVAPAVRGRSTKDENGRYVGKAPAFIVDYKAAVRYLRYNHDRLPAGDVNRIIVNGTSAGGALSTLIGASGNSHDYDLYLKYVGAASAPDDVYAVSAYCPITNLENADAAYEWIFSGVNEYHQVKHNNPPEPDGKPAGNPPPEARGQMPPAADRPENAPMESIEAAKMSDTQIAASRELKKLFITYVNSLNLQDKNGNKLTLNPNGEGTFADYIKKVYQDSAEEAIRQGKNLNNLNWLTIDSGAVTSVDLKKYAVWATRMKATPAFDKFDLSSGENDEFAVVDNKPLHFSNYLMTKGTSAESFAPEEIIHLMNPMNFIGREGVKTAQHWRIRHGAKDRDTSIAIPAILALALENQGVDVDFSAPWGFGHDGDYDLDELFSWIDSICRN